MSRALETVVERTLREWAAAGEQPPLVVAVSGGLDSMVLLDGLARVARARIAVVATFDHGTGQSARASADLVAREAGRRGLTAVTGRAPAGLRSEAEWREARWRFLREVAARVAGHVATAHTRDDQVETVLMRALRGAGARGLAGLAASSHVARPLLTLGRPELAAHAASRGLAWVEDPSNADLRHLRNRVRRELLPALARAHPELPGELLAIGERAAAWRDEMERLAAVAAPPLEPSRPGRAVVAAADLAGYDSEGLAVLWGAIAWRAGLALDRRGTLRLVEFTMNRRGDAVAPLAGGWEVARIGARCELRRAIVSPAPEVALPREGAVQWGRWRFSARAGSPGAEEEDGRGVARDDPWVVVLSDRPLAVRGWQPGDRITGPGGTPRRVKRFLSDAGVRGADRAEWPVVVDGEEILWIPGVRRSDAATARSGRPALTLRCDRIR